MSGGVVYAKSVGTTEITGTIKGETITITVNVSQMLASSSPSSTAIVTPKAEVTATATVAPIAKPTPTPTLSKQLVEKPKIPTKVKVKNSKKIAGNGIRIEDVACIEMVAAYDKSGAEIDFSEDYQKCAFVSDEALDGYSVSDILPQGNYKIIGRWRRN